MSKQDEAQKLLNPERTATYLVTIDEEGRPDARAMAVVTAEGLKTIWMMTCKLSEKYRQLSKNPQCMLYATDLEDKEGYLELRLWGRMELLDDAETKNRIWLDAYLPYFPGGKDDPNLGILKFTTEEATLQTLDGKEELAI